MKNTRKNMISVVNLNNIKIIKEKLENKLNMHWKSFAQAAIWTTKKRFCLDFISSMLHVIINYRCYALSP